MKNEETGVVMGNGEWGMGNGEWGMGNGEWYITDDSRLLQPSQLQ